MFDNNILNTKHQKRDKYAKDKDNIAGIFYSMFIENKRFVYQRSSGLTMISPDLKTSSLPERYRTIKPPLEDIPVTKASIPWDSSSSYFPVGKTFIFFPITRE